MSEHLINTIIVDDESLSRQLLKKLLGNDASLNVLGEYCDGESAFAAIKALKPQLVLMDIHMPQLSGIETVERLLPLTHLPYVIFITAFDEHAIKAFELGALDYLVKPINKQRLIKAIERAKSAIAQDKFYALGQKMLTLGDNLRALEHNQSSPSHLQNMTVFKGEQIKRLPLPEIVWVEALNQYLKIHTLSNTYILSENLAQFSKKLDEQQFVRVHRSSIINLNHLCRVDKKGYGAYMLVMRCGAQIKLARSRTSLLERLLTRTAG